MTADALIAWLDAPYLSNDYEHTRRRVDEARSKVTSDEETAIIEMFEAFLAVTNHQVTEIDRACAVAIPLLDAAGRRTEIARCLTALAFGAQLRGDLPTALRHCRKAEAIFLDTSDSPRALNVQMMISGLQLDMGHSEEAFETLNKILDTATRDSNRLIQTRALDRLGRIASGRGEVAKAIEFSEQAVAIARELQIPWLLGMALTNRSIWLGNAGNNDAALAGNYEALEVCKAAGQLSEVEKIYNNIGNIYFDKGQLAEAYESFQRALSLEENTSSKPWLGIGNVYAAVGDLQSALDAYTNGLNASMREEDRASMLLSVAAIHSEFGRHAEALDAVREAEQITRSIESHYHQGALLLYQGKLFAQQGEAERAKDLFYRAIDAVHEKGSLDLELETWICIAELEKDVVKARAILDNVIHTASTLNLRIIHVRAYRILRTVCERQGDLRAALHAADQHFALQSSLAAFNQEHRRVMIDADIRMAEERQRSQAQQDLLYTLLPREVADRLVRGEQVTGDHHDRAAVLFVDIVGFTQISEQLSPPKVVALLQRLFSAFDEICKRHGVTKIKTIGDSYMAVAFPEQPSTSDPSHRAANTALDILRAVADFPSPVGSPASSPLSVRIGIHSGTLTAGVIGTERLQYDVWGDTVNVASRLESTGEPGKIQVSEAFAQSLRQQELRQHDQRQGNVEPGTWHLALRGDIDLKGKGLMTTYWLVP